MILVESALALAARRIPVFPCKADKAPACAGGFKSASTDPATVRALFANPAAVLIGVPTGAASGLDVLDADPRHGSDAWLKQHGRLIPPTLIHGTRSGGQHYFFRHRPGLRCSSGTGQAHRPGIDVKADGGYIVHWASAGVPLRLDEVPAEWPDALLERLLARPAATAEPRDLSALAPPSAAAVVDLLAALPNPASVDRDIYAQVMLAASGCIQALGDDPGGAIEDAAVGWAERWEAYDGADERQKWHDDWSTRTAPKAGWHALLKVARRLIPGFTDPTAGAEFDALPRSGLLGRLRYPADCMAAVPRGYIVKHILAPGDVAALIGPPSAGKSVVAPHIAYAVAQGRAVFGLRTKPGRVLYAAAEDASGMRQRVRALYQKHGDAPGFATVDLGNLRDPATSAELREAVAEWKPALVVLDTLGAAWAGLDENSSVDMGEVVRLSRELAATGAAVLLIHHIAKHGDGSPRGHSVLNGTLDMCLALGDKAEDGTIRAKILKNRNGTPDREIAFRIGVANLGMDEDGDAITAPVAVEIGPDRAPKMPKLNRQQSIAWGEFLKLEAETAPDATGIRSVSLQNWKDFCVLAALSSSSSRDGQRTTFNRTAGELYRLGIIAKSDAYAWRVAFSDHSETNETERDGGETVSGHSRDGRDGHPRGVRLVSVSSGEEFLH